MKKQRNKKIITRSRDPRGILEESSGDPRGILEGSSRNPRGILEGSSRDPRGILEGNKNKNIYENEEYNIK